MGRGTHKSRRSARRVGRSGLTYVVIQALDRNAELLNTLGPQKLSNNRKELNG